MWTPFCHEFKGIFGSTFVFETSNEMCENGTCVEHGDFLLKERVDT